MEDKTKARKRTKKYSWCKYYSETLLRRTEEYRMRYVENITQNFVVYGV